MPLNRIKATIDFGRTTSILFAYMRQHPYNTYIRTLETPYKLNKFSLLNANKMNGDFVILEIKWKPLLQLASQFLMDISGEFHFEQWQWEMVRQKMKIHHQPWQQDANSMSADFPFRNLIAFFCLQTFACAASLRHFMTNYQSLLCLDMVNFWFTTNRKHSNVSPCL